jgi:nucleotide-binding universal stress UspA family protein
MYDDVLVPTDGSAAAEAALITATDLAAGRIHALSVVDDRAFLLLDDDLVQEVRAEHEAESDRALDAATALDPAVEPVRREGDPAEEILAYAEEAGVDAVVLGVGDPGYEERLLGRVSERVIASATVPVLTVPVGEEPEGLMDARR